MSSEMDPDRLRRERQWQAGVWLRDARNAAGIHARDFASALGITPAQLYNLEGGKHRFGDERAALIAAALNADIIDVRRNLGLWVPDAPTPTTEAAGGDDLDTVTGEPEQVRQYAAEAGIDDSDIAPAERARWIAIWDKLAAQSPIRARGALRIAETLLAFPKAVDPDEW